MSQDNFSVKDLRKRYKCGRKKVYALAKHPDFPAHAKIGRAWVFNGDAVEEFEHTHPDLFPPGFFSKGEAQYLPAIKDKGLLALFKQAGERRKQEKKDDRARERAELSQRRALARTRVEEKAQAKRDVMESLKPRDDGGEPSKAMRRKK